MNASILKPLAGTLASSIAVLGLTFLSGVVIARVLGPEARGVYGAVLLAVQTLTTLSLFSLPDAFTNRFRKERRFPADALPTILISLLVVGTVTAPLVVFIGNEMVGQTGHIAPMAVLIFTLAFLPMNILTVGFCSFERSKMRFKITNITRVSAPLIFTGLLVLSVEFFFDQIDVAQVLYLFLAAKLPMLIFWFWHLRVEFSTAFNFELSRSALIYGVRLHPAIAIALLSASLDRLLGISLWDPATLGQYFVAYSAVGVGFGLVVTSVRTVLFPYLSGLLPKDRSHEIPRLLRFCILASAVAAAVAYVILPVLVPLVFGRQFADAANLARALILPMAMTPFHALVFEANRSTGASRASTEMALASIMIMALGFLVLGYETPYEVIYASAVANLVSLAVGAARLAHSGDLKLNRSLLPNKDDLALLKSALRKRPWP